MRAISQVIMNLIKNMYSKIKLLKLLPHIPDPRDQLIKSVNKPTLIRSTDRMFL